MFTPFEPVVTSHVSGTSHRRSEIGTILRKPDNPHGGLGVLDIADATVHDFLGRDCVSFAVHGEPSAFTNSKTRAEIQAASSFIIDSVRLACSPETVVSLCAAIFYSGVDVEFDEDISVSLHLASGRTVTSAHSRERFELEKTAFGYAHILYESDQIGLYILEIGANQRIPAHLHYIMDEIEMIMDDGLLLQGVPVRRGDVFSWRRGVVHEYQNPNGSSKRILCIDRPRFVRSDEVVVAAPRHLRPAVPLRNYFDWR